MPPSHPPAEALVGSALGARYRIVQLLGSGGTGHVYLAEPIVSERSPSRVRPRLALKVLRAEHAQTAELVARFEREAVAASRIRHPNLLEVHELEQLEDGLRFFAMELLVGLDLADTLAFTGSLAPARAVRIASGVASGLAAAHAAGIVHRDVKPENVFLVHAADGRELVKLLDFGFAWLEGDSKAAEQKRITSRITVVGTPEYMAPEQAQGADAHAAADIYSLGIVLYEMLAGRVPFQGDSYPAIAHKHVGQAPERMQRYNRALQVSSELEAIVMRAISKSPDARHPSMDEMLSALLASPEGRAAHP